jgi:hypothetical protein
MFKHRDFEDFLQDKHGRDYIGTDDDMPDAYDSWIENLDSDDWMRLGQQYGLSIKKAIAYCIKCGYEVKECDRNESGLCIDCFDGVNDETR